MAAWRSFCDSRFIFLLACISFFNFFMARPKAARPSFCSRPIIEMVGGPPTKTGKPMGMGKTTLVGSCSDFIFVFFLGLSRMGAGIPILWQERAGRAR